MHDNIILSLKELTKQFGGIIAVSNINLDVEKEDIFGVIGPNGAGKTTIFNLITGIYAPTSGKIYFNGEDITKYKTHIISQKGIARTFQNIRLFNNLSSYDNILIACHDSAKYDLASGFLRTRECKKQEKELAIEAKRALNSVGLLEKENIKASSLPYGEQRKLELARAIATKPNLLLLDEPAAGMNPNETKALMEFIKKLNKDGYTIAVIEHDMKFVMNTCNRILVLSFGKKICEGNPEHVKSDKEVNEAYFGKGILVREAGL